MLHTLTATEVAFVQIATLQAVAALLWLLGAWLAADQRRALAHWALYAGLASSAWFGLALQLRAPALVTVLGGLGAALALRRGIRLFIGSELGWPGAALAVGAVLLAASLPAEGSSRATQAVLNFGALAAVYVGISADLWRHARDGLHWRWPALLALPAMLGAAALAARAMLALVRPGSVITDMTQHSTLNIASALAYTVLVLLLHATLLTLLLSRLLGELHQLARRDPLTGLLNRRAMHAALDKQARRVRRAADTFSVLMIDIDHFKAVNDRHGHDAGDQALTHVARLLTQSLRTQDRVSRFGGEEFVVLLPDTDADQARTVAEQLRLQVRGQPTHVGGGGVPLSVSIGVAQWAGPTEDLSRLLSRADAALYRAKHRGRDCVETAADAGGEPQPGAG
jgi:diguanylate cyclase (GGDEF)-like protein